MTYIVALGKWFGHNRRMAKKTTNSERQPVANAGRKSDAISMRVDPVTKYALDLSARVTRRSVSGVLEEALDSYFETTMIPGVEDSAGPRSIREVVQEIWSPNEVERLVMLGIRYPKLLEFDEARMFKVIVDSAELWEASSYRREDTFKWRLAVELWDTLRPMVVENAQKPVVKPLSLAQLNKLGLSPSEDHPELVSLPF